VLAVKVFPAEEVREDPGPWDAASDRATGDPPRERVTECGSEANAHVGTAVNRNRELPHDYDFVTAMNLPVHTLGDLGAGSRSVA
jgi:hypothetical protein